MRKKIFVIFVLLPVIFTLMVWVLPAEAADPAPSGKIEIEDRTHRDGELKFTAVLPDPDPHGQVAVSVYGGDGRSKESVFYTANETGVDIRVAGVESTDEVRAAWLDADLRILAESSVLRMEGHGVEDYEGFTSKLMDLLERSSSSAGAGAESFDSDDPYALARLIVGCDDLPADVKTSYQVLGPGPGGICIVQCRTSAEARKCAERLQALTAPPYSVRYAEPDQMIVVDVPKVSPTAGLMADEDPLSSEYLSWGVAATGIGTYAKELARRGIHGSVTVAVVDSGVDQGHPFLAGRLLSGYDFLESDEDPQDLFGHGTRVAGIIVDCTPDADVKILPVRVLDEEGRCESTSQIALAICYAADHGANVINLSLSAPTIDRKGEPCNSCIDEAVGYALSKNVTVVAAAGNQAGNVMMRTPARVADCITVSAIDKEEKHFPYSNDGDAVDLAAPGEGILSSVPRGTGDPDCDKNYGKDSGTSFAAPHVSAAVALLLIERGTSQTPAQISNALRGAASTHDLGTPGWDRYYGAGMLDMRPFMNAVITYDPNGGTGTMEAQTVTSGATVVLRTNTFTRTGYHFTGWNTRADGSGAAYTDGSSLTTEKSLTLYAQWEEESGIYGILYADGELVFQNSRLPAPGSGTVLETYPVRSATGGSAEYAGWYDRRDQITKVTFAERIRPASTALWFYGCVYLTTIEGLDRLDTSAVTNMSQMFAGCSSLTELDLSAFDTSKVTAMRQMFYNCTALRTIDVSSDFVTTAVTSSADMFFNCRSIVGGRGTTYDSARTNVAYARIDGGTSAPGYFTDPDAVSSDIYAVLYADGDLVFQNGDRQESGRTVTEVYEVKGPYKSAPPWYGRREEITTVTFADKIRPTSTACWFYYLPKLTDIRNIHDLDTSNVTDMLWMFNGCSGLTELDVSGFDTTNVTSMYGMFWGCDGLKELDASNFDTSNVTDMRFMFDECSGLTELDVSGFDTSNVTDMWGMFEGCSELTELDVSGFDTSNVTDMRDMFEGCSELTELDVSGFDTSNVTAMGGMFSGCSGLTELDVSGFDTSDVTSMDGMFWGCSGLARIYASSRFVTMAFMSSANMFYGCTSLVGGQGTAYSGSYRDKTRARIDGGKSAPGYFTDIDMAPTPDPELSDIYAVLYADGDLVFQNNDHRESGRTVKEVYEVTGPYSYSSHAPWYMRDITTVMFADRICPTSTAYWFYDLSELTAIRNIHNLDTSNVTDMGFMFYGCSGLTELDVSSFDTSNVIYMFDMFGGCSGLTELDVSGFDTSNVTYIAGMFDGCGKLTELDVSGFDTSNVIDMTVMFYECSGLTELNLSGFDTSNTTYMDEMFRGCSGLNRIYASSRFVTSMVESSDYMFFGCTSLVGGRGTTYDSAHTDVAYARIDGGTSAPGYFTEKSADETSGMSAEELFHLGEDYFNGANGRTQDYAKSIYYYEKAAEKGDMYAMNDLGYIYQHGYGTAVDYAKALDLYQQAAELGNPHALNNLGYMYENGLGVTQDYQKAEEFYQQAADGGSENASTNLLNLRILMMLSGLL